LDLSQWIFIVEDDEDIRIDLGELLTEEGYTVSSAADGREALEVLKAAAEPPCVILLDLMMPGMNGWQLRAELLKDPRLASVPIVLLSAASSLAQDAATLGAASYLPKPFQLSALLNAVGAHCRPP
jgi:CheY-like chemotaxis protein